MARLRPEIEEADFLRATVRTIEVQRSWRLLHEVVELRHQNTRYVLDILISYDSPRLAEIGVLDNLEWRRLFWFHTDPCTKQYPRSQSDRARLLRAVVAMLMPSCTLQVDCLDDDDQCPELEKEAP
jgi:hypothetical protein